MDPFVVRLIVGVLIIWLTQVLLDALKVKEPGKNVIFVLVVVVMALYIAFGAVLPIRIG